MTTTTVSELAQPANSRRVEALRRARGGERIFLLAPGNKVPLKGTNGHLDATTDEAVIDRWFQEEPEANYGIALSEADLVIDADPRNYPDGRDVLSELLKSWFPNGVNTEIVATPRGGYHIRLKKSSELKLKKEQPAFPGIDFLSKGNYVVGPGSVTVAGSKTVDGAYTLYRQAPICDAPKEQLARLEVRQDKTITQGSDFSLTMEEECKSLCEMWEPAIAGMHGNDTTYKLACQLWDRALPVEKALEHITTIYNPRCIPAWEESDLHRIIKSAYKTAKSAPGNKAPEAIFAGMARLPAEANSPAPQTMEAKGTTAAEATFKNIQTLFGESSELWRDHAGAAYATVEVHGHREHYKVTSRDFRLWLQHMYRKRFGKCASSEHAKTAIEAIEADARFNGTRYEPAMRLAKQNGRVYLDLCNDAWQVVEVSQDGWRLLDESPIKFVRTPNMRELPIPEQASPAALIKLRSILNLPNDSAWALFIGFTFACLNHGAPNPVLVLHGEQGSAKSFHVKTIRRLIDPANALTAGKLSNEKDLLANAANGHVLALDNLSYLRNDLSDSICRLATEGGNSFRQLYSDGELFSFNFIKPVVLTGIESFVTRGDLLSRSIVIELPTIPDECKKTDEQLCAAFEVIKASALGALLTAVSGALRRLPETNPSPLPRLADMAKWVTAAEPELGLRRGEFLAAYWRNELEAAGQSLEASPVAQHILEMELPWKGTAEGLRKLVSDKARTYSEISSVPKTSKAVSDHLRRLAPDLRRVGIEVTYGKRTANLRPIQIERLERGLTWRDVI